jgi:crotonobetainyl-CoA:carnitine CoA-transferase CaiB-like acyl-CoA transferase
VGYEDLGPRNPRLIYASFTAYGETGDEADKTGFDATAYWARSGLMDQVRADSTAPPARSVAGMGDHPCSIALYAAIVTALYRREKTGTGSHVGSSLLANGLWANACSVQSALCGDFAQPSPPRAEHVMPWRNSFKCSDGKWLMLSIVHNDGRWDTFRKAVQSPLLDDPRFQTTPDRRQHGVALTSTLDKVFAQRPLAEWSEILDRNGVVFGVCYTMADVPNDEQAKICGALVPTADGAMMTVSSPFWIAEEDKIKPKAAPAIGQHNDEVLTAAGYNANEIQKLRADGIVG